MSTVLNVKIDPKVKIKARRVADKLGLSLSGVVNVYLREFVRSEALSVSLHNEQPSPRLISAIRSAERDRKAGKLIHFSSGQEALRYIDDLITKKK